MSVVCLDLDGTLEDSRADMVAAVLRVRRGLSLPERAGDDFVAHVNRGMPHLYAHCFAEHLDGVGPDDPRRAALIEAYAADYGAHIADQTRLYEGMADALAALASQHVLALVTNKPEALSAKLLAALGVDQHFAAIIGGDTLAVSKPDPGPLREGIRRAGGGPAVFVGDSRGDIKCAAAAGVPVIWCAWGYLDTPGPAAPDAFAERPSELPAVVAELLALVVAAKGGR